MRLVLVAGTTETARIEGISAAGARPDLLAHTPAADAEIVAHGHPVFAPTVPVSPTGAPTPAVVTRAIREIIGFDFLAVDAGLAASTAAPTVTVGTEAGADIRESEAVPGARGVIERSRELGRTLLAANEDEPQEGRSQEDSTGGLLIGETIPGGTTTALGVLRALGEAIDVSSSLGENPLMRKRQVVADALAASGLEPGGAAGNPVRALRHVGDPALAGIFGLALGALDAGQPVTFAGGTQFLAAAALVRHAGRDEPLTIATTPFVAGDTSASIHQDADALGAEVVVTDPGFSESSHVLAERYRAGEAKEGVGMGGALALAATEGVPMNQVRERSIGVYERLTTDTQGRDAARSTTGSNDTMVNDGP